MSENINHLKRDLKKLTGELYKIQEEWRGEPMPEDIGRDFEAKAKEAESLQNQIEDAERESRVKNLDRYARGLPDTEAAKVPGATRAKSESNEIAGYVTLGDAVVASAAYQRFLDDGAPRGDFPLLRVEEAKTVDGQWFVPLTRKQREEFESKATPTIGSGVIDPQRLPVVPQATRPDQLRLRDIISVGRTSSNAIEYAREVSYTSVAEPVAEGAAKPEATAEWDLVTSNVRTIAAWMPATTQQLADVPQLRSMIDGRLRHDVLLEEEEQVMFGSGSGQDFEGLTVVSGTHDIATADARVTSPTLADQIRVGITEVRRLGKRIPNAVVMHSLDFETLSLLKGTDDHYLAQVFPAGDQAGGMRVWGLRIVESLASEFREDPSPTNRRSLIVGDFQNGCSLFIREDVSVQIGMQADDFIKNLRTVLAEERAAFAIFEPKAFAVLEIQASG